MPRAGQANHFSDPLVEKKCVRHGENINFTRVVVTLAFLRHQTSHLQHKFCFTIIQYLEYFELDYIRL